MEVKREIPSRAGVKVFLNGAGLISIQQTDHFDGDKIVVVYPEDVPRLIRFLEEVQQEALEDRAEEESENSRDEAVK